MPSLRILSTRDMVNNHIGGSADVYIDGVKVGNYENNFASNVIPMVLLYEITGLSDTEHSVRIVVTSTLGGWGFDFDCIDIKGEIRSYNPIQESALKVVLEVDEELQLSVDDDLDANTEMSWTSSDNAAATVDENGIVTALAPGNTVITVTSEDGTYTDYINVLVVDDADDLRLAVDLKVGKSCRLTVDDLTGTVMATWASMDPTIATVSTKGKVTAVSEGLTLITATDEEGNIIGQVYVRVRE